MADVQKPEPLTRLEIVDKLNELRAFVECAALAVTGLFIDAKQKNAVTWTLLHAMDGLDELAEQIHLSCKDEPDESGEAQTSEG